MSKLRIAVLTAIIALPLGAFAGGALRGHPNLEKARASLNDAERFIAASQKANEHVWSDEGGHGRKAKEAIDTAKQELDLAAEWVNAHPK
ncbi:MAG TPA: hypothetical protein VHW23_43380 [Kofleriaceae bacterium]|jgi:hypothetical protein|nr:hypothetical protein [Kofleriaceae bacterium]